MRQTITYADKINKVAKESKYLFFLTETEIARVDFSNLYRKKGDCIFVIFSKLVLKTAR